MEVAVKPALIEALIAGLGEDPPWSGFVAALREELRADYASIVFRPFGPDEPNPRVVHFFAGEDSPPAIGQLYRDRLHRQDPLPYDAMVPGRVHALPDLLDTGDPAHAAYRRDLLAPSGMNYLRMVRVTEPRGVSAWLSASRRLRDFDASADLLLAALAPFLTAALSAHVARERERTEARVAGEAIRRMNFGWLTLDAAGIILDANDTAEAFLADRAAPIERDRAGRLRARSGEVNGIVASALAATGAGRRPRAVVLSRQPWLDLLLVPIAFRSIDARRAPSVILYLHADRWTPGDHHEHLHALFDLTPSESRLALALSRGMTIAEAAGELGLSVGSARTYTKRIYAKTGARGQADLIRFIYRSVMALS